MPDRTDENGVVILALDATWAGLLGVTIGGLLAFGGNALIESRRQKHERDLARLADAQRQRDMRRGQRSDAYRSMFAHVEMQMASIPGSNQRMAVGSDEERLATANLTAELELVGPEEVVDAFRDWTRRNFAAVMEELRQLQSPQAEWTAPKQPAEARERLYELAHRALRADIDG
jgi:hypothetical protein